MRHEEYIRECHALAISAGNKGNHTFGAVLVRDGEIIMRAENSVNTEKDGFCHAEYNLVIKSKAAYPSEVLAESTLYTSTAPCFLCTAAILASGIGRIVFSVSYEAFDRLIPGGYKYISCAEVAARLGKGTEVIGPILEEEGLGVFQYWEGREPCTQKDDDLGAEME